MLLMHNITLPLFNFVQELAEESQKWCTELLSERNHRYCSAAPALLPTKQPKPLRDKQLSVSFSCQKQEEPVVLALRGYFLSQHSAECSSSWCPAAQFKCRVEGNPSPAEVPNGWQSDPPRSRPVMRELKPGRTTPWWMRRDGGAAVERQRAT